MKADALLRAIIRYGADTAGIRDRFEDNYTLYIKCLESFLGSPQVTALDKAVAAEDYKRAFAAAHALKGISGNLGLTPYYDAVCPLVELLRLQQYDAVNKAYDEVKRAFETLKQLYEQPEQPEQTEQPEQPEQTEQPGQPEQTEQPQMLPEQAGQPEQTEQPQMQPEKYAGAKPAEAKPAPEQPEQKSQAKPDKQPAKPDKQPVKPDKQPVKPEKQPVKPDKQPEKQPVQRAAADPLKGLSKQKQRTFSKKRFLAVAAAVILPVFLVALLAFMLVGSNFREKTRYESGQHLLETGRQIRAYLGEQFANDWRIADSLSRSLAQSRHTEDEAALLAFLEEQRQAWEAADIMLYTADGYCIYSDGRAEANGTASETLAALRERGSSLSVINSTLIYTLPVDTDQTLYGEQIIAVSLVRSMDTLLDELDFTSFNNRAWIYLTAHNGIIISRLTASGSAFSFNIETVLDGYGITSLDREDTSANVFAGRDEAFYLTADTGNQYLVTLPINDAHTDIDDMFIFYLVPESAVNDSSRAFATQLTVFSSILIALLVGLTSLTFFVMYRSRSKKFDAALSAREQLFDLLIQNMRTVFGLFDTEKPQPPYISGNAAEVLGEAYWTITRTQGGYRACTASGAEPSMLRQANSLLKKWDGRSVFRSGYLCDDTAAPPVWFELILYPVGESGTELVGIMQDVTAVHEREEAAKTAMEMAKRSDKAKTRFLANMSHDIRTPMNAIMNMSRFAIENADEPIKRDKYLNTIYESSVHLLHLINDILDMSRIESGQTVVAAVPFDLKAELAGQVKALLPLCTEKRQTFLVNLDGIRTEAVCGDSLKVTQIVMNLLSNAIKFTPEGGAVRFTAEELPSLREELVDVRFVVEDNGMGIPAGYLQSIFDPFSRADSDRVSRIEGTGLGLSICKSYVDAMGGRITCQSDEGEGSTFTVELCFERANRLKLESTVLPTEGTPFLGLRCLVLEDIETNRIIARELLERLGFLVDFAEDGRTGLRKFLRSTPRTYDIIYMDIQLPQLDGCQTTALIRESVHPQARSIPIIAMSASVLVEDVEKARIAGMDGYVSKPIVSLELLEQTMRAFELKGGKPL